MRRRALTFAFTGNADKIRPFLELFLLSKGLRVAEYPAVGIKGLICGDAHVPSKAVTSHRKYKRALENKVSIVTVENLP